MTIKFLPSRPYVINNNLVFDNNWFNANSINLCLHDLFLKPWYFNIDDLCKTLDLFSSKNDSFSLFYYCPEFTNHTQQALDKLSKITSSYKQVNQVLILLDDTCYNENLSVPKNITLIYDVFNLYRIYTHCKYVGSYNNTYNPIQKMLYLMGKPNKKHRIGLLHRFFENKQLDNLVYSCYLSEELKEECQTILQKLYFNNDSFNTFFETIPRVLDDISNTGLRVQNNNYHYSGYPFDTNLYKTTGLSVISETTIVKEFDNGISLLSEKTFRAIQNKHPFIIVGQPNTYSCLNQMGFKTFDQYFKYNIRNLSMNEVSDYDMIIDNCNYFLNNLNNTEIVNSINNDIEHNFNLLMKIGNNLDIFFNNNGLYFEKNMWGNFL